MDKLPDDFVFSQSNLQNFMDCALRFRLRYLERMPWPAPFTLEAQGFEAERKAGDTIHRLIRGYFEGLDPLSLLNNALLHGELTEVWLRQVMDAFPLTESDIYRAELRIDQILGGVPATAIYDLVGQESGKVLIIDWKSSNRRPNFRRIRESAQKRLFPLVMAAHLQESQTEYSNLEMTFWELNFPESSFRFIYNQDLYAADLAWFIDLTAQIKNLSSEGFRASEDLRKCRYCQYQSYCRRGPAEAPEQEQDRDEAIDAMVQAGELEIGDLRVEPL